MLLRYTKHIQKGADMKTRKIKISLTVTIDVDRLMEDKAWDADSVKEAIDELKQEMKDAAISVIENNNTSILVRES